MDRQLVLNKDLENVVSSDIIPIFLKVNLISEINMERQEDRLRKGMRKVGRLGSFVFFPIERPSKCYVFTPEGISKENLSVRK